jgi:hypothetical protein
MASPQRGSGIPQTQDAHAGDTVQLHDDRLDDRLDLGGIDVLAAGLDELLLRYALDGAWTASESRYFT